MPARYTRDYQLQIGFYQPLKKFVIADFCVVRHDSAEKRNG